MTKKNKTENQKEKNSSSSNKGFSGFFRNEKLRFIVGLIIMVGSCYIFLSLTSFLFSGGNDYNLLNYSYSDLIKEHKEFENLGGASGARLADIMINKWFGVSSFFLVIFAFSLGLKLLNPNKKYSIVKQFISCAFFTIWISLFFGVFYPETSSISFIQLGGNHGNQLAHILNTVMGVSGIILLLGSTILVFLILAFISTLPFIQKIFQYSLLDLFRRKKQEPIDNIESDLEMGIESEKLNEEKAADSEDTEEEFEVIEMEEEPISTIEENDTDLDFEVKVPKDEDSELVTDEPDEDNLDAPLEIIPTEEEKLVGNEDTYDKFAELGEYDPTLEIPHYKFPTFDLLQKYDFSNEINLEEQAANKKRITETLENYGIKIKKTEATVGPTVTLYEIIPEAGVRISKIRSLEDDIALSLSALGIRIIAPIPGKGTIGIEVPNKNPQIVSIHSVIASKKFQESKFDLPIVFGKTITNEVFIADLCKMPHILVAGATGQGKSVGLNAIITSLLYKKHPSQLKFVLIDPKKVEFSIYSSIEKYFLAKLPDAEEAIITDVTKVVQTLNSLTKEMDSRYDLLKKAHVRTIKEYNAKFVKRSLNPEKGHRYLPYIVVIIDEFGDLIMTAGKDIELPIARIAQLARAVGIHMIIATQRPSTNIITGSIKANFPTRVAFRVSSMIDSRTILDCPGANQLIGRGDMLFSQGSDLIRVQCAFVDTPEIENIGNFIESQRCYPTPFYLPEAEISNGDTNMSGVDLSVRDPMFEEAARLLVIHQQGSTSMIQRKFSIGYNRAGRIVDQLEVAGILGFPEGSKPRQVLVQDEMQLDRILDNLK